METEERYAEYEQEVESALAKGEIYEKYKPGEIPPFWQETLQRYGIKIMNLAMTFGAVIPEFTMKDYIMHAVRSSSGYETVNIWGCLSADTKIITKDGIQEIGELCNLKNVMVLSNNDGAIEFNLATPFYTGKQTLYEIATTQGTVYATSEHPFYTNDGWKETKKLRIGERLLSLTNPQLYEVSYTENSKDMRTMQQTILNRRKTTKILHKNMQNYMVEQTQNLQETQRSNQTQNINRNTQTLPRSPQTYNINHPTMQNMRNPISNISQLQKTILLQIMRNQTQKYDIWQPNQQGICTAKDFSYTQEERQTNIQKSTRIPIETSRNTPMQRFEPESAVYDPIRESNCFSTRRTPNTLHLEQTHTFRQPTIISRLPNQKHQNNSGMQWRKMAQQRRNRTEKQPTNPTWLHTNNFMGQRNNQRPQTHHKYAIVLSIKELYKADTYNLTVQNAHNFYLANGLLTHNSQGSKKSCRTLAVSYWAYGDWDTVLEEIVLLPDSKGLSDDYKNRGFIQKMQSVSREETVPLVAWDDYTVGMPSSTFKTDIEVYGAVDAAWAAIRTKTKVMVLNCPLIDRIGRNVKDNITIEVMLGRNQVEQIERFVRLVGLKHLESNFFKVQIEPLHKFDYKQVPKSVFDQYFELRKEIADYAIHKMGKAYQDEAALLEDMVGLNQIRSESPIALTTLSDMIKRGFIESEKINGKLYIKKQEWSRFIEEEAAKKQSKQKTNRKI